MARKALRHNHFTLLASNSPGTLIAVISAFEETCGSLKSVSAKQVAGTDSLVIQIIDDKLGDKEAQTMARLLKNNNLIQSVTTEQIFRTA